MLEGKRVAVLGLGRSGVAVARAAKERGATVKVYDQASREKLAKPEMAERLAAFDIQAVYEWIGDFHASDVFDIVIPNPSLPRHHSALKTALEREWQIWGEIEFAYRISKAPIVAVTGTNGKSTTAVMTYLALLECGEDAILCGNIFGSGYPEMPLTEAADLATENHVLVAEVSSFQLEWVKLFRPVSAGITTIDQDHLDRYDGSRSEYAATKLRLFHNQTPEEFSIVRANDPMVPSPSTSNVLTFGATGEHARIEAGMLYFLDKAVPPDMFKFTEPHNFQNALTAALLAYGLLRWKAAEWPEGNAAKVLQAAADRSNDKILAKRTVYNKIFAGVGFFAMPVEILEGLYKFDGLAYRMERVGEKNGITVINNSMCTNPDAVLKSAQAISGPTILIMGGVNKGLNFAPLRRYVGSYRHRVVLFGKDGKAINDVLGGNHAVRDTLKEAFWTATAMANPGDTIMLAPGCASSDQFRDFRHRGDVFNEIAKDWLSDESSETDF